MSIRTINIENYPQRFDIPIDFKTQYGEVTTDLSDSTAVVNMYVYIVGEDIMSEDSRFERD